MVTVTVICVDICYCFFYLQCSYFILIVIHIWSRCVYVSSSCKSINHKSCPRLTT